VQTAAASGSPTAAAWAEAAWLQLAVEEADPEAVLQHERELARATRRLGVRMSWLNDSIRWMLAGKSHGYELSSLRMILYGASSISE
jgi:hypothetical protein